MEDTEDKKGNVSSQQLDFDGNEVKENTRSEPDNCEFSGFCDMEGMLGGFPNCFRPFDDKNWTCRRYAPHCTNDPDHCCGDDGSIQCRTCRGCVLSKVEMAYTHFHPDNVPDDDETYNDAQLKRCMFTGSCGIELTRKAFPKCFRSFDGEICKHYASCDEIDDNEVDGEKQLEKCKLVGSCDVEIIRGAFPQCYISFDDEVCKYYIPCSENKSVHD